MEEACETGVIIHYTNFKSSIRRRRNEVIRRLIWCRYPYAGQFAFMSEVVSQLGHKDISVKKNNVLKERDESLKYVSISNECKVVCKKGEYPGD